MKGSSLIILGFAILVQIAAQLPPQRLSIPGAVLISQPKAIPFRTRHHDPNLRLRRPQPIPNAVPAPVRPVVEEPEENTPPPSSSFEDEVTKLGISALQSAVRQAVTQEEEPVRPVQFRPERPIPVLRENVRENPQVRPQPILRGENYPRPLLRQEVRDEGAVKPPPQRHQLRQQIPLQPTPQPVRQVTRGPPRQPSQYLDDESDVRGGGRTRKPPVQILRKYRTDNADGSITWGFENEDGTFKEETLGVDCVTRGKYGYIDPDGVRRDYSYETGNKCDQPEEEEEDDLPQRPQIQPQSRKQPQYRPPGSQI